MSKLTPLLLVATLGLVFFPTFVATTSHWESYEVLVLGYDWICYPYTFTVCNDWLNYGYYLGWGCCGCELFQPYQSVCYTAQGWNCYTSCLHWLWIIEWRCQYGWTGCNCDVPICDNPTCTADQWCKAPNQCDCFRGSTGLCELEPCDDGPNANCYPGYCNKTGSWACVCVPGFTGSNCQTITHRPEIMNCQVQLFGTPSGQNEQQVAVANECAAVGLAPPTVWVGAAAANSLTKIVAGWEAHYSNPLTIPTAATAPYILNAPVNIGITESNFTVSFPNQTSVSPQSLSCVNFNDRTSQDIQRIQECYAQTMQWRNLGVSSLIRTNFSFVVSIEAQLGGAKEGNANYVGGRFNTPQIFSQDPTVNSTIQQVKFAFDLEAPYHCLSLPNNKNCSVYPIFLNESMTSNPVIQPTFNDWHDDGSGIDRYHVEVFYLQPDPNGLLGPVGGPQVAYDVNITLNNFRYTCPTPGVYAIVLTVFDKANNSAMARKIFNYDDHASSCVQTAAPVYLDKADPRTGYQYITNLTKPDSGPYQFNLVWTGHFNSSYKPEWLGAVEALPPDPTGRTIDDIYGTRYGLRSVDKVTTMTGVIGYEIAYMVDKVNGGLGATPPLTFTPIRDPTLNSFSVSIDPSLADGDAIVVWLRAYDIYGAAQPLIKTLTYVDTSKFNTKVTSQKFQKHFPDEYNSSVVFNVTNRISGIKQISFTVYDNSKKVTALSSQVQYPQILTQPSQLSSNNSRKKRDAVEQPCVPSTDPTCYCIPTGQCFSKTQLINIDNCWIDRLAGDDLVITYTIYSGSGQGLDGSVDAGVLNEADIPCRGPFLSTGAIIGISFASVIAFILLVLLIILLLLLLLRWKVWHKHPIPTYIRTAYSKRFHRDSTANIMSENEIYASKTDDVKFVKNTNETKLWAKKQEVTPAKRGNNYDDCFVSEKDLNVGDVVAEGRFAVIRKGQLMRGNERTPVAVKALRSGYNKSDPDVMRSKIAFMANELKPHPNIVKFMGAINEENDEAPVMLLELCDMPLKDWLSDISQVDSEVLEDMLTFTLNIARGLQHLHDQKIIHRRLAVRNVLLKNGLSGLEAKLIGFGPSRDDSEQTRSTDDCGPEVAVVPLKWLAPETLDTVNLQKPTYDEKTDAWSFGVTIWEIYSKGAAPFSEHKSSEIRAMLKKGERLTCPDDCPPELYNSAIYPCWNSSPKKRPNLTKICNAVEKFRNGCAPQSGYYTAPRGRALAGTTAAPPGYYSARTAFQSPGGIYHEATSG